MKGLPLCGNPFFIAERKQMQLRSGELNLLQSICARAAYKKMLISREKIVCWLDVSMTFA